MKAIRDFFILIGMLIAIAFYCLTGKADFEGMDDED